MHRKTPIPQRFLSLNAEYGGRTELLQLPDEALAIKKAIDRLGAPSAEDCSYTVTFHNFKGDDWLARVQEIIAKEGIYETNAMLKALDVEGMDWSKLSAVVELVDVQKASNIAFLAEHLDEFSFIPEAKTEEDVGHFLVDNISEYRLNLEIMASNPRNLTISGVFLAFPRFFATMRFADIECRKKDIISKKRLRTGFEPCSPQF